MKDKAKKIIRKILKYGSQLDKVGKVLLLVPSLRVWGTVVMVIDAFFDIAWAEEQKKKVNQKISEVKK